MMMRCLRWLNVLSVLFVLSITYGCGDEYTLSLTPSGLSGTLQVTISKNSVAGDTLTFTSDTAQTFTTKLTSTDAIILSIVNPSGQTCAVENLTATIGRNTTLTVLCSESNATVSGVITGLAPGEAIELGLNNGENQALSAGAFSYSDLPIGYPYKFTLLVSGPGKHCTITNSEGTVSENVTSLISCQTVNILFANGSKYFGNMGGHSGADQNCALIAYFMGPHITCDVNTAFLSSIDAIAGTPPRPLNTIPVFYSFNTNLPLYIYDSSSGQGETYFQANWNRLFEEDYIDNYRNISFSYPVWSGSRDSGSLDLFASCLGFTSSSSLFGRAEGLARVMTNAGLEGGFATCDQPQELACACLQQDYQVGGTISGLASGESVEIQIAYGSHTTDDITLIDNGSFYSNQNLASGETYSATIVSASTAGTCSFSGDSSGTVSGSSSSALTVTCGDEDTSGGVSIGGTVTGLSGTVILNLNDGDQTVSVTSDGDFTFETNLTAGSTYEVTIGTQPTTQTCTITNGTGTASGSVSNITVTCATNVTIGGTVTGLSGTVVMNLNSGAQTVSVSASGSFTFGTNLAAGATYAVTVGTQPTTQTCVVTNGSGTASADVSNVTVTCAKTLASIAVTPANPSVNIFTTPTRQFTATGTYSDATTADLTTSVTWASSSTSVATIASSGLATLVTLGTTNITATFAGVTSNTSTMTVVP